ncbi:hypothetical protein CGZ95_03280 [Enemella evansiae]|nr:hypothetical protein CGZ95_03280 [Enemella evansiae]
MKPSGRSGTVPGRSQFWTGGRPTGGRGGSWFGPPGGPGGNAEGPDGDGPDGDGPDGDGPGGVGRSAPGASPQGWGTGPVPGGGELDIQLLARRVRPT